MRPALLSLLAGALLMPAASTMATETGHSGHVSPYAGEQARTIKSLSSQDIDDLMNGRGWGLAKAAELNGVPGPAHILEMREEIALTADQAERIEAIRERMQADAIRIGTRLVALEAELDNAFASGTIEADYLRRTVKEIESARGELRYVHLAAHLEAPGILTPHQIAEYNRLRGYGASDPCTTPPPGHDPAMWRKHNKCD